ncbi:MAG: UDP-3-O-(3-hydroxymyristoyl)glucosamine N-acyltransferase [Vicinamibacteria bacterium]|nr:UDP-3-O-(3-hydroxymyristoyl)glucosamine N-acyltransferase [Vicinamibacteria bacterium]
MKLDELAEKLGCLVRGDGCVEVRRVRSIEEAGAGDLTFVASARFAAHLKTTHASAVIVAPSTVTALPSLISDNPYLAFAKAVALLHPQPRPAVGVHPSAQVDASAVLGRDVHVGALAVVGPRVRIGARTIVHPHVTLYEDVVVGEDCILHSGAQVRELCRLGDRVVVQNGATIGGDGFGFARDGSGRHHKIPQVGVVVIEDDVEIGALAAVDRAALGETRIGRGTKIDNLVQVAHSVRIGENTILCSQVGIAGSSRIGSRVTLAGQVGVVDHATIGDDVIATAQTGVAHVVAAGACVSGYPAIDNRTWLKAIAVFPRLPEIFRRLRELEKRIAAGRQG